MVTPVAVGSGMQLLLLEFLGSIRDVYDQTHAFFATYSLPVRSFSILFSWQDRFVKKLSMQMSLLKVLREVAQMAPIRTWLTAVLSLSPATTAETDPSLDAIVATERPRTLTENAAAKGAVNLCLRRRSDINGETCGHRYLGSLVPGWAKGPSKVDALVGSVVRAESQTRERTGSQPQRLDSHACLRCTSANLRARSREGRMPFARVGVALRSSGIGAWQETAIA